jgi:tetratricopeptide (TPR) repeat protein
VHKSVTVLSLILTFTFSLAAELSPEARLDSGVIAFRAKDYASAEPELSAAALELQARLAPGSSSTSTYERALVYLALTQFRLGREDDARQTILRLAAAEKVDPVYASLALGDDTTDFDALVTALAPEAGLTSRSVAAASASNATDDGSVALPPVLPAPAPVPEPIRSVVVPAATSADLSHFTALRQAVALADAGQTMEAIRIWESLVDARDVAREVLIEAAIGLYRIGAYRQAVGAFDRLGTLGRGEEDLRYYHAVVLYETGNYEQARRELACALPFIQVTDEVERYRLKINQPTT